MNSLKIYFKQLILKAHIWLVLKDRNVLNNKLHNQSILSLANNSEDTCTTHVIN